MDASSLSNITQDEFEKSVEIAIQELPPSPTRHMRPLAPTDMSPFSPSTPGEEPARPLTLSTSFPALDNTKRFFQRTGNQITESVSKPLNAIGKILDTMQQDDGSESGDETERSTNDDRLRTPQRRDRRALTPESPSRRFAALGLSPESQPPSGA